MSPGPSSSHLGNPTRDSLSSVSLSPHCAYCAYTNQPDTLSYIHSMMPSARQEKLKQPRSYPLISTCFATIYPNSHVTAKRTWVYNMVQYSERYSVISPQKPKSPIHGGIKRANPSHQLHLGAQPPPLDESRVAHWCLQFDLPARRLAFDRSVISESQRRMTATRVSPPILSCPAFR